MRIFFFAENAHSILMNFLAIRFNINYHRAAASRATGNSTPSSFNRWIDLKHAWRHWWINNYSSLSSHPKELTQRAASFWPTYPFCIPRERFPPQPLPPLKYFTFRGWCALAKKEKEKKRKKRKRKKRKRERESRRRKTRRVSQRGSSLFLLSRWSPVARTPSVNIKGCAARVCYIVFAYCAANCPRRGFIVHRVLKLSNSLLVDRDLS